MADLSLLEAAFSQDVSLRDRVLAAAQSSPDTARLALDIVRYYANHSTHSNGNGREVPNGDAPAAKKRKLSPEPATQGTTNGTIHASHTAAASKTTTTSAAPSIDPSTTIPILALPDISFSIPMRKKATLTILGPPSSAPTQSTGGLVVESKDTTYTIPWSSIAHTFCLPVPDRAAKAHNFVLLLHPSSPSNTETQFVFTLPETPYVGPSALARDHDTSVSLVGRTLNTYLAPLGTGVVLPSESDFASAVPQAHRKGEKGYHVKAHVGSKEGYLFFLSGGILFGFKKPVLFFPFDRIESTSYTSVLQRTFNLVVTVGGDEGGTEETEFGMIDQVDFAGIDAYVKGRGLEDASLAAERRARRIGVNDPRRKKGEESGAGEEGEEEDGEGELAKAERELQDQEDEEEEDYDPGSEGESEGEGSESEEEEGEGPVDEVEGEEDHDE
ncbi:hypothetical protein CAC42_7017 [Sphaceloma murrayae]|uniref:Histone chaperone RTT106/FACT complex subunit SPT16-like middle domain-containing protein n=1 Tax=Sphaceloma murrayae TaxID=2082308 RepID=A0A2K1QQH7_9PEZI|nr:hypothetical protein CAC42_7017 [Sphaceloma murrayae]